MPIDGPDLDAGAMLDDVARSQGVSPGDVARLLVAFPESLRDLLAAAWTIDGAAGFLGAYQLLDILEELGCAELRAPDPACLDPVVLTGRRTGGGGPVQIQVTRLAWRLGRRMLTSLLRQQLGEDGPRFSVGRAAGAAAAPDAACEVAGADAADDAAPTGADGADAWAAIHDAPVPDDADLVDLTLSGNVDQIAVPDLLRMLCRNGRTGALRLGAGGRRLGAIYLLEGRVVHATADACTGVAAVAVLAAATGAVFVFTTEIPDGRSIDVPVEALVMEAMRVVDERRRA